MKTLKLVLEVLILINTLFIIISNYITNINAFPFLDWFTKPRGSFNVLYILLIIFLLVFAFIYNSKYLVKLKYRYRANRFYKNRIKLKNLLVKYQWNTDISLQAEYEKVTFKLKNDYHFFIEKIHEIQFSLGNEHINLTLRNFEECFSVREIKDREWKVRRRIPDELDCFDFLVIGIKEFYNK